MSPFLVFVLPGPFEGSEPDSARHGRAKTFAVYNLLAFRRNDEGKICISRGRPRQSSLLFAQDHVAELGDDFAPSVLTIRSCNRFVKTWLTVPQILPIPIDDGSQFSCEHCHLFLFLFTVGLHTNDGVHPGVQSVP